MDMTARTIQGRPARTTTLTIMSMVMRRWVTKDAVLKEGLFSMIHSRRTARSFLCLQTAYHHRLHISIIIYCLSIIFYCSSKKEAPEGLLACVFGSSFGRAAGHTLDHILLQCQIQEDHGQARQQNSRHPEVHLVAVLTDEQRVRPQGKCLVGRRLQRDERQQKIVP